jgi:hypothetical protein
VAVSLSASRFVIQLLSSLAEALADALADALAAPLAVLHSLIDWLLSALAALSDALLVRDEPPPPPRRAAPPFAHRFASADEAHAIQLPWPAARRASLPQRLSDAAAELVSTAGLAVDSRTGDARLLLRRALASADGGKGVHLSLAVPLAASSVSQAVLAVAARGASVSFAPARMQLLLIEPPRTHLASSGVTLMPAWRWPSILPELRGRWEPTRSQVTRLPKMLRLGRSAVWFSRTGGGIEAGLTHERRRPMDADGWPRGRTLAVRLTMRGGSRVGLAPYAAYKLRLPLRGALSSLECRQATLGLCFDPAADGAAAVAKARLAGGACVKLSCGLGCSAAGAQVTVPDRAGGGRWVVGLRARGGKVAGVWLEKKVDL